MAKNNLTEALQRLDAGDLHLGEAPDAPAPYVLLRFMSSVAGGTDLQKYYLLQANEANRNFFNIGNFVKLQFATLGTISPKVGKQYHPWIGGLNKNEGLTGESKADKLSKSEDLRVLEQLNAIFDAK